MRICMCCYQMDLFYLNRWQSHGPIKLPNVLIELPVHEGKNLAAVCYWADEVKHHYHYCWSSPLQYVDTPDFRCNYKYCRDCHDSSGRKDRCVTGAIYNYTKQLELACHDSDSLGLKCKKQ